MVSADSTVIYNNIPSPQSDSIPLLPNLVYAKRHTRLRYSSSLTFFTSKRFFPSTPPSAAEALDFPVAFLTGAVDPEGASVISTSAMLWWRYGIDSELRDGGV